jgi:hypothetical protein
MAKYDGGPAFPKTLHEGMTLRDWFAGQAAAGMLANRSTGATVTGHFVFDTDLPEVAYKVADAMLKARRQGDADD